MASGEVEGVAVAWFTDGGSVQVLAAQGVLGGDAPVAPSSSGTVGDCGELRAALDRTPALVAVNDAGAGFASLRHVLLLEPSFIKLDRSWVSGIQGDPARQALVAGIAHLSTGRHRRRRPPRVRRVRRPRRPCWRGGGPV
jgi:hypothetical protein